MASGRAVAVGDVVGWRTAGRGGTLAFLKSTGKLIAVLGTYGLVHIRYGRQQRKVPFDLEELTFVRAARPCAAFVRRAGRSKRPVCECGWERDEHMVEEHD